MLGKDICSPEGSWESDGVAAELQWWRQDLTAVQLKDTFKSCTEKTKKGEKMPFKGGNLVPSQQCFHPLQVCFVTIKSQAV